MKIALATLNGTTVTSHFGRTKGFVVVNVEDGIETAREFRETSPGGHDNHQDPGHNRRHHDLVGTISDCGVVIAGGMGHPIQERLQQAGLEVVLTGVRSIDDAVTQYVDGSLGHDQDRAHAPGGDHRH